MNFKERIQRAFPGWRQLLRKTTPMLRQVVVAGAVAGDVAVTAIKKGDQLVSVIDEVAGAIADRTAEFVVNTDAGWIIRTDGIINNTGGASTASNPLIVTWLAWAE